MDEQNSVQAQSQRSGFWVTFSILCVAGAIIGSMISQNAVQRYRAQQQESSRQMQVISHQLQQQGGDHNFP